MGFIRLNSNPYIYKKTNNKNIITCLLAVYVDDIIISETNEEIENTINLIKKELKIKEIDLLRKYDNYLSGSSTFIKPIENNKYKLIKSSGESNDPNKEDWINLIKIFEYIKVKNYNNYPSFFKFDFNFSKFKTLSKDFYFMDNNNSYQNKKYNTNNNNKNNNNLNKQNKKETENNSADKEKENSTTCHEIKIYL
ncbi:hypothetical protein PIROE2DRAFT_13518 [Piromyces sp. E2]|nr:hypothetical protein PIROE2DRAFT_13518 [Piromyces sp. E2]|eukprot:OUM60659.1 hypothetical protein PIROE2DRAFT_13518 [Piromyces sp. E2]